MKASNRPLWRKVESATPPENVLLLTKIDDEQGERNIQMLRRSGKLWFVPDGATYVYYTPTHWAPAGWGGS